MTKFRDSVEKGTIMIWGCHLTSIEIPTIRSQENRIMRIPIHGTQILSWKLQWRHNEFDWALNDRNLDCLLNRLFRHISKKTSKLRGIGLCEANSPVTGEFPTHRARNAENVPIWWRLHETVPWNSLGMPWSRPLRTLREGRSVPGASNGSANKWLVMILAKAQSIFSALSLTCPKNTPSTVAPAGLAFV